MAEQVDVCINNSFTNPNVEVFRQFADGTRESGSEVTISGGSDDMFPLYEPGIKLVVTPDSAVDFGTCWFKVTENGDLVSWERKDGHWTIEIAPNPAVPEVPTTVNITVGGDEP
jgi:hypothetical protein